ncbi:OTU protein [Exophiala xenobiotica]|uniref:OTU protein n=1 Tax=Lithohypha guttulata TaxID=1690604 RepID=A0ABR0K048_9EURO|nr:OTU protein [Lithohypha guttulata]KAK5311557.1 OTU protein [Exophiala xenobiotica]
MDELQARHRKEQKELQGVNDECDRLEQELRERQQGEIQALAPDDLETETAKLDLGSEQVGGVAESDHVKNEAGGAAPHLTVDDRGYQQDMDSASPTRPKKQSRQKARLARRTAEQEAQVEAAAEEAANMPDQRQQELSAMRRQMEIHGLTETMIRPDGHCLYSACAHSIGTSKAPDYRRVRTAAAEFMTSHSDDFAPFMEEPIESYTRKIKDTAEWGGHLELQAIAKVFSVNINVLQANGHIEQIKPEQASEKEIWLAYYKHSFGLGEHYNALQKASAG